MVQRETFGCLLQTVCVCHLETWSLYNNQLLLVHMMLLVLFAGWNCSETKPKQNRRHFKQLVLVHTTRTQNSKHCWRQQEFTILLNIVVLYLSFSNYRPKSGMAFNNRSLVEQWFCWKHYHYIFLTKFEILSWRWPHCWPRDWAAKFTRTLWGSRRRITQLIVVYKFSRPFL